MRADHRDVVAVMPIEEAIAPRFSPKPWTAATAMAAVLAVPLDDGKLDHVLGEIDARFRQRTAQMLGDDLARQDADDRRVRPVARGAKVAATTGLAFTLDRPTGATAVRLANSAGVTIRPPEITCETRQSSDPALQQHDVGARVPGAIMPLSASRRCAPR